MSINKKKIIKSETDFGYKCISPYLVNKKQNYKVLEIGAGTGFLLSKLSKSFPNHIFDAIEPYGPGFKINREFKNMEIQENINLYEIAYENFKPKKKYDLIFLINVFEHLENWKHFLETIVNWLSEEGKCIILCPNYNFPYESHFKIPLIINKKITKRLFKTKIRNHEISHKSIGLWDSLNFVKKTSVIEFCKNLNVSVRDNYHIHQIMIDRFQKDKHFQKRQSLIGNIGLFVKHTKTLKLFSMPLFKNYAPYMMLEITKRI